MIILGLLAGALTGISFFPQSIKLIKKKDTSSISLLTYLLFTLGVLLWIIYGFIIKDLAVLLTNLITIIPCLTILFMKIQNG
ncbi:SemiSWEET transporter [Lactococcus garvieae]